MFLARLVLQNFRNYKERVFEFSPKLTVIIGPNTAGKTNILEAIYLLATGGSFRARVERECIMQGEEITRVQGRVLEYQDTRYRDQGIRISGKDTKQEKSNTPIPQNLSPISQLPNNLEIVLTTGSVQGKKAPYKKYLVNGVGRRKSDFVGNFYAVLFNPQDIELVTNSPSRRRSFLDNILIQTSSEYARALTEYEKALRRRNKILFQLKDVQKTLELYSAKVYGVNNIGSERLEYWDKLLVENGQILTKGREKLISFLNKNKIAARSKHMRASNSNFKEKGLNKALDSRALDFKVEYEKSKISYERLREYSEKEAGAGYTLIGPHRDDFVIKVQNYIDLSKFGSRGEQRLGVLWLKLGEIEYLKEKTGECPVLLLDDIFSELDHENRELVDKLIPGYQTVITTADRHYVEGLIKKSKTKERYKVISLDIIDY